jgi:hypothetical protein
MTRTTQLRTRIAANDPRLTRAADALILQPKVTRPRPRRVQAQSYPRSYATPNFCANSATRASDTDPATRRVFSNASCQYNSGRERS